MSELMSLGGRMPDVPLIVVSTVLVAVSVWGLSRQRSWRTEELRLQHANQQLRDELRHATVCLHEAQARVPVHGERGRFVARR